MLKSTDEPNNESFIVPSSFSICLQCIYFIEEEGLFCSRGELQSFGEFVRMGCDGFSKGSFMVRISRRVYDRAVKHRREEYLLTKSVSTLKAQKIFAIVDGKEGLTARVNRSKDANK